MQSKTERITLLIQLIPLQTLSNSVKQVYKCLKQIVVFRYGTHIM